MNQLSVGIIVCGQNEGEQMIKLWSTGLDKMDGMDIEKFSVPLHEIFQPVEYFRVKFNDLNLKENGKL
jgi:hypothetical protein